MQGDNPPRWPENFPASKGMLFPVWFVFRFLLQNKSMNIINSESSDPLEVNSLVFTDAHSTKMMVANYTSNKQEISFSFTTQKLMSKELNEETFNMAAADVNWLKNAAVAFIDPGDSFHLNPYSICFLEEVPVDGK